MGILLNKDVSRLNRPGLRNVLRPAFPKVPASGTVKARGSNQWSTLPKITGPLKFGFRLGTSTTPPSPVPELLKPVRGVIDRKSTRLNSSHLVISYAVFCLKKK